MEQCIHNDKQNLTSLLLILLALRLYNLVANDEKSTTPLHIRIHVLYTLISFFFSFFHINLSDLNQSVQVPAGYSKERENKNKGK